MSRLCVKDPRGDNSGQGSVGSADKEGQVRAEVSMVR